MEIQWFGNTTFLIKTSLGKRILVNPIDLKSFISKYDFKPDIITLSSTLYGININEHIETGCKLINSCEKYSNDYISITGYSTYCDNINGLKRGGNIIYIFEVDNFKFCHLGTLGHNLDPTLISKLKDLDFLLIPIGGHFSLDGNEAVALSTALNAKYIVPMLYKLSMQYSYLDGPYNFLCHMKNISKLNTSTIQTSNLSFKDSNSVLILTP